MIDLAATISAMEGAGMSAEQIVVALKCVRTNTVKVTKAPAIACRPHKPRHLGQRIHDHPKPMEWEKLKSKAFHRDDFICKYCGFEGQHPWKEDGPVDITADHVVPLSRGGTNDLENLVCCCIPCNNSKSDRLISEWRGRYGNGETG